MYYRIHLGTWCKYISVGLDIMNVFVAGLYAALAATYVAALQGTRVPLNHASHSMGLRKEHRACVCCCCAQAICE